MAMFLVEDVPNTTVIFPTPMPKTLVSPAQRCEIPRGGGPASNSSNCLNQNTKDLAGQSAKVVGGL